jgi:hypothetical protein
MTFPLRDSLLSLGEKLIDRLWPDPSEKAKARLELVRLAQTGELRDLEFRLQALIAEAQSADPWISRAHPSYLYTVYLIILWAIPMGVLHAIAPETARAVTTGMREWWAAIPTEFWTTFAIGYSGYTLARSIWDKRMPKGT